MAKRAPHVLRPRCAHYFGSVRPAGAGNPDTLLRAANDTGPRSYTCFLNPERPTKTVNKSAVLSYPCESWSGLRPSAERIQWSCRGCVGERSHWNSGAETQNLAERNRGLKFRPFRRSSKVTSLP